MYAGANSSMEGTMEAQGPVMRLSLRAPGATGLQAAIRPHFPGQFTFVCTVRVVLRGTTVVRVVDLDKSAPSGCQSSDDSAAKSML